MSYVIKHLHDDILIAQWNSDYDRVTEGEAFVLELIAALNNLMKPIVFIQIIDNVHFSMSDIIDMAFNATKRDDAVLKHHMIQDRVVVTSNRAFQLIAKGLNSASFGHVKINIFNELDDALQYALMTK